MSGDHADEQDAEALRMLRGLAQGKNAPLPPEALVQHVPDGTPGGAWPLRPPPPPSQHPPPPCPPPPTSVSAAFAL